MLAILADVTGRLLAWAPTLAELPPAPPNSTTRTLAHWADVPPPPFVWTPAALDWTIPATTAVGWSPLAFLSRYTVAEQVAIELAKNGTTPGFTAAERAELAILERSVLAVQDLVRPDDPRTQYGVARHVALGLLTPARAAEILDLAWSP
jgi:hypothetical protein